MFLRASNLQTSAIDTKTDQIQLKDQDRALKPRNENVASVCWTAVPPTSTRSNTDCVEVKDKTCSFNNRPGSVHFYIYLLSFESSSQHELLVLLSDLNVVDFVLVEDHQGEGLVGQLPGAVPHQVGPVLNTETNTRRVNATEKLMSFL